MNMYKKVYMRLPYIYDTVFCNDFGNMKTNHVSCNMTNELKSLLKISTVLSRVSLSVTKMVCVRLQDSVAPAGGGSGTVYVEDYFLHTLCCV